MRKLILLILCIVLLGCTSIKKSTKLSTNLNAKEYNSIESKYIIIPTFVAIEEMSDGKTVLSVSYKSYENNIYFIRFSKDNVQQFLSYINKFIEWERLAKSRNDQFTKEIGKAISWGNTISGNLKFTFHSGNIHNHFLEISFCAAGTCLDDQALFLDAKNALELAEILAKFEKGKLENDDINSIYK